MSSKNGWPQYVRASLISVVLTAVAITVNHTYTLGTGALVLGVALVVVPAILLMWFRKTESKAALIGYLLINAWILVGFGLLKGLWDTTFRLFLGTLLSSLSTRISEACRWHVRVRDQRDPDLHRQLVRPVLRGQTVAGF